MLDFKEIADGETWELFARDFLKQMGFFIESDPSRGADGGKDFLVTERLDGKVGNYKLRWLVSCKNYAHSNSSINETIEQNILERVRGFKADGFIGLYSTLASAGLTNRLTQLKANGEIKDYRIFDHKLIENYLINIGFSNLLMRYFPMSYKLVKPLHILYDRYYSLDCDVCGKDLLEAMYKDELNGIIGFAGRTQPDCYFVEDVYVACKGECDRKIEARWLNQGINTTWSDLKDLSIPTLYIKYVISTLNNIRSNEWRYSDKAFNKERQIIMKLAQKVLQEMSDKERERHDSLAEFGLV